MNPLRRPGGMTRRESHPSSEIDRSPPVKDELSNRGSGGFPYGRRAPRGRVICTGKPKRNGGAASCKGEGHGLAVAQVADGRPNRAPCCRARRPVWAATHLVEGRACRPACRIGGATQWRWRHSSRSGSLACCLQRRHRLRHPSGTMQPEEKQRRATEGVSARRRGGRGGRAPRSRAAARATPTTVNIDLTDAM
jgi:hypothetical protein